jgi:hypothetical protein
MSWWAVVANLFGAAAGVTGICRNTAVGGTIFPLDFCQLSRSIDALFNEED